MGQSLGRRGRREDATSSSIRQGKVWVILFTLDELGSFHALVW